MYYIANSKINCHTILAVTFIAYTKPCSNVGKTFIIRCIDLCMHANAILNWLDNNKPYAQLHQKIKMVVIWVGLCTEHLWKG